MSRGGAGRPRAGCCKACEERDALGNTQWGKCHGKEETTGREFDLGKQTIHSLLADKHQGYLGAWGLPPTQNGTFVYPRRCLQTQPGKSWRHPEPVASHSALISNSECQGALRLGRQQRVTSPCAQIKIALVLGAQVSLAYPLGVRQLRSRTCDINT